MFMFLMDAFAWIFVIVVGACLAYFALLGVFIGVAKVVGKLWKERRVLSVWIVLFAAALALSFVEDVTRVVVLMCVASGAVVFLVAAYVRYYWRRWRRRWRRR
jgi:hypothetical protein